MGHAEAGQASLRRPHSVYLKWLSFWQPSLEASRLCVLWSLSKVPLTSCSPGLLAFLIKPCLERYLLGGNFGLKLEERNPDTKLEVRRIKVGKAMDVEGKTSCESKNSRS